MIAIHLDDDRKEISNPDALALLLDVLDDHATGVRRIFNVTIDGSDTFRGNAEQPLPDGRSQYLAFKISADQIAYRIVTAQRSDSWHNDAVGVTKKAGKKLNCRSGNIQCGGKCQSKDWNCNVDPTVGQKSKINAAIGLSKKTGGDRVQAKTDPAPTKPKEKKIESKPTPKKDRNQKPSEKGGAISPVSQPKTEKKTALIPRPGAKGAERTTEGRRALRNITTKAGDRRVIEAMGHGKLETDSYVKTLSQLKPKDSADQIYRQAILDPSLRKGAEFGNMSSLDRTRELYRIRNRQALTDDDADEAADFLRQGVRGTTGSTVNRANLAYGKQIYARLNERQKDIFASKVDPDHQYFKSEKVDKSMFDDIRRRRSNLHVTNT